MCKALNFPIFGWSENGWIAPTVSHIEREIHILIHIQFIIIIILFHIQRQIYRTTFRDKCPSWISSEYPTPTIKFNYTPWCKIIRKFAGKLFPFVGLWFCKDFRAHKCSSNRHSPHPLKSINRLQTMSASPLEKLGPRLHTSHTTYFKLQVRWLCTWVLLHYLNSPLVKQVGCDVGLAINL